MGSVKDLIVEREPTKVRMGSGIFDFSDRYSVFDWGEMPDHIPNKGAALCTTSAYFFERAREAGVATHYNGVSANGQDYGPLSEMNQPPKRMGVTLVRVIKPVATDTEGKLNYDYTPIQNAGSNFVIPLEVIYRNSLPKGSSVFRRLREGTLTLGEMGLTEQPVEGQRLATPFVDASTKYEEFDRYPGWAELQKLAGLSTQEVDELKSSVLMVNGIVSDGMSNAGFFNEDGKFEFAYSPAGQLMLVDTLGTLDECRITYNGVDVSKQIPRDWYAYSQPEWKAEIETAKARSKKDWKSFVAIQPKPLPTALRDIMSGFYAAVANQVVGRDMFSGVAPIDELLAEYQKFRAAEMK